MVEKVLLRIDDPAHEAVLPATGAADTVTVTLSGATLSDTHGSTPLFHKWYSSLAAEIAAGPSASAALRVGSHVLTFSAADQDDTGVPPAGLEPLYASMQHMGYAGGAPLPAPDPDNPGPMVIHVLVANMIAPDPATAMLSKAAPDLRAEVPLQWAAFPDFLSEDPVYHALNRVALLWRFEDLTDPGQPEVEIQQASLTFHPSDGSTPLPWLGLDAPLPPAVVTGDTYRLTLRVQDATDPATGHEVSRDVGITA